MSGPNKEQRRLYTEITGKKCPKKEKLELDSVTVDDVWDASLALVSSRQREIVQAIEAISIKTEADAIEKLLKKKGFSNPSVYTIFTGGFSPPEGATYLGKYQEEGTAFAGFPRPDIKGHDGQVYAAKTPDGRTMLFLVGRAHPNDWSKEKYGDMIVAHPLQVLKEIARRQRAKNGEDPLFVLTYAVGVREGFKMQTGDLAVTLADTPGDANTHPGQGARGILDLYTGGKFQNRDGRASTLELAGLFIKYAKQRGINIFVGDVIGTLGPPEFQDSIEAAMYDEPFQSALLNGNFGRDVRSMASDEDAASQFCMGVTAELAVLRQTFIGEKDFIVLALTLATDAVGGQQSRTINHEQVYAAAMAKGKDYRDLILDFLSSPEYKEFASRATVMPDHSIKRKFKRKKRASSSS